MPEGDIESGGYQGTIQGVAADMDANGTMVINIFPDL
jgi:hypothetical protein